MVKINGMIKKKTGRILLVVYIIYGSLVCTDSKNNVSYRDGIISLLNFTFTGLQGYEITPGLSTNKQRHCLLLLKTGIHVAPTHH